MAIANLKDEQIKAISNMKNGCILCGDVGSGKSRTAIGYYYKKFGGDLKSDRYIKMSNPKKLYIITTAHKRDTLEWEKELTLYLLPTHVEDSIYDFQVEIDSWNNIEKYKNVKNSFFIFDEQRVVGYGKWSKTFIEISKYNDWILLTATPGDTWMDYIPVFIANGFYKHKTDFVEQHVIYSWKNKNYPKVDRYINTGRLIRLRNSILVNMEDKRKTIPHHEDIYSKYDIDMYKFVMKERWNIFEDKPIKNASEYCSVLRKIVNIDNSRQLSLLQLFEDHPKMIIFYNFDYELFLLKELFENTGVAVAEWNGHKHQPIPKACSWVYLVQYNAGAEGWNCIETDTIVFYSQCHSYKMTKQASGRIDRLNTPFTDLYYYHLKSHSSIDMSISRALKSKKDFNMQGFYRKV